MFEWNDERENRIDHRLFKLFLAGRKNKIASLSCGRCRIALQRIPGQPNAQAHMGGIELPTSAELQKKWLERVAGCQDDGSMILFAVEDLAGTTVGWLSLHSRDQKNGTFSLGVAIYRAYRGHRYGADAVRILLKYGFWEQRYQKCNSVCAHSNLASRRMHARLGFVQEGQCRRNSFFNGQYRDDILFGMTREEFDEVMKAEVLASELSVVKVPQQR